MNHENTDRRNKTIEALTDPNCGSPIGRFKIKTPDYERDMIGGWGLMFFYCAFDYYTDDYKPMGIVFLIIGILCVLFWLFYNNNKAEVDGECITVKGKKYVAGQLDRLYADYLNVSLECAGKRVFSTNMMNHHADSLVKWARANNIPIVYDAGDKSSHTKQNLIVLFGILGFMIIFGISVLVKNL